MKVLKRAQNGLIVTYDVHESLLRARHWNLYDPQGQQVRHYPLVTPCRNLGTVLSRDSVNE